MTDEVRTCKACRATKPTESFGMMGGFRLRTCRECRAAHERARKRAARERRRLGVPAIARKRGVDDPAEVARRTAEMREIKMDRMRRGMGPDLPIEVARAVDLDKEKTDGTHEEGDDRRGPGERPEVPGGAGREPPRA